MSTYDIFSVDTDMFFFMVLRNNRLYCAWGPMDHREFLGLFIIFKACVHVNQCGSAVGRLLFPFWMADHSLITIASTWHGLQTGSRKTRLFFSELL